ncbi:MAG: glycosyltransferase family 2 protein, partial [Bacteroidetes bacterium]
MKNPLISVIVPNYNHAPYLLERIESILSQSFQDFELILLDDFSTDQSKEVLKKYQNHEKVSHLLLNEKNSGSTFKQWNKGISLAKGKYIWL